MEKGTYISKARRDAHYRQLKQEGKAAFRRTFRGARLHPQYITDAAEEGITFETGFGNTDYLRTWDVLYIVEAN